MPKLPSRTTKRFYRKAKPVQRVDADNSVLSEHQEQVLFIQWFRRTYKDVRIFAIPNGEARSKSAGARLKAEGVSAGVPDLFIPAWNTWIEMKRSKGGRTSDKQKYWLAYLESVGHKTFVCAGFDNAKIITKKVYKETLEGI